MCYWIWFPDASETFSDAILKTITDYYLMLESVMYDLLEAVSYNTLITQVCMGKGVGNWIMISCIFRVAN